jgi:hypothetical protein
MDYVFSAMPVSGVGLIQPIFFPGTPELERAERVQVRPRQDEHHVDLVLPPKGTSRITGTVLRSNGSAAANLWVRIETELGLVVQVRSQADGRFDAQGLQPGRYFVGAQESTGVPRETFKAMPATESTGQDVRLAAGAEVSLQLRLMPSQRLAGHIAGESPTDRTWPGLYLRLSPTERPGLSIRAEVEAQQFVFRRIPIGKYQLEAVSTGDVKYWLRSVEIGGRNMLGMPIAIDGTSVDVFDAAVIVSTGFADLRGTVRDADGKPNSDYWVVTIPIAPHFAYVGSPHLKRTRPATDGQFDFRQLPAGEYVVAMFGDSESDWQHPAVLDRLRKFGVKVTLPRGGLLTQDLRIAAR